MFLDVANETEQLDIGCGSDVPAYSATFMTGSQRSALKEVERWVCRRGMCGAHRIAVLIYRPPSVQS